MWHERTNESRSSNRKKGLGPHNEVKARQRGLRIHHVVSRRARSDNHAGWDRGGEGGVGHRGKAKGGWAGPLFHAENAWPEETACGSHCRCTCSVVSACLAQVRTRIKVQRPTRPLQAVLRRRAQDPTELRVYGCSGAASARSCCAGIVTTTTGTTGITDQNKKKSTYKAAQSPCSINVNKAFKAFTKPLTRRNPASFWAEKSR